MRRTLLCSLGLVAVMITAAIAQDANMSAHVMSAPKDLKWGDPPPVFEKGASFTLVSGDPSKEGLYVVRLKMPAGLPDQSALAPDRRARHGHLRHVHRWAWARSSTRPRCMSCRRAVMRSCPRRCGTTRWQRMPRSFRSTAWVHSP